MLKQVGHQSAALSSFLSGPVDRVVLHQPGAPLISIPALLSEGQQGRVVMRATSEGRVERR